MLVRILLIALGGALGTVCRYGMHEAGIALFGRSMSLGILASNVVGCLLLGFVATYTVERVDALHEDFAVALTIGFMGGLTTFSTFAFDTVTHAQDGRWGHALLNIALNLVLGLGAAVLGWWLAVKATGGGAAS